MHGKSGASIRRIGALMLPIVLQNLISAVVNSADVFMLSSVGQDALSASSLAGQVTFVLNLFYLGLTTGVSVLASQYWGKRDTAAIGCVQGLGLRLAMLISALFFLATLCIPQTLMRLFTQDEALIALGAPFLRVLGLSYLPMGASQMILAVMKSMERTRESAVISTLCLIVNILLNALSIFVLFRGDVLRAMLGVAGATAAARAAELMLCLAAIRRGAGVRLARHAPGHTPKGMLASFARCTLPVQANYLVWGCAQAAMASIMGHMGSDMVSAHAVAGNLCNLVTVVCSAWGAAGSILVGKALGAGKKDDALILGRLVAKGSLLLGAAAGAALLALRGPSLALSGLEGGAGELLSFMMIVNALYCVGKSYNSSIVGGVLCAGGDTLFGLVCDTVSMWGVVLPVGFAAAFVIKCPPAVVYALLCLDEYVKLPAVLRRFGQNKWLNDLTKEP